MVTSKAEENMAAVYFTALSAMMYYSMGQAILVPFAIPVRQIIAVAIIFSGFVCFLVRPNIARANVAFSSSLAFAAPMLVMVTVSLPVWFAERASMAELYQEMWNYLFYTNQLIAAFVAAVFLYMFGQKGIWYNLAGILAANLIWIISIMAENGVGPYLRELVRLVATFAGETGKIIGQAEVHELAFCLGAYIVYMLLHPRKSLFHNCMLLITFFCFLSAFKRIAVGAVVLAAGVGFFLKWLHKMGCDRAVRQIINITLVVIVMLLVCYIAFIKWGGFHLLEQAGIDTMSRADMYDRVDQFYEFSPDFWGHGMGYLSYQLTRVIHLWENAIHNDYLQFYIDLGFWGYIFWLLSLTVFRTSYYGREKRMEERINTFVIMCYILVLSTTDNTLNFQMLYTVSGILIMGHTFDRQVQEVDRKLFGYVEEQNRVSGGQRSIAG